MANEFFTASNAPSTGAQLSSATIRAEFSAVEDAMDKLPAMAGSANKILKVNAGSTSLTVSSITDDGSLVSVANPLAATTFNKVTVTAPATGSTLTIADGKTLTASNTLTLAGTDGTTLTFQGTDTYVGRATTDTLTNKSISGATNTLSAIGNASLTNSSITIGTTSVSLGGTAASVAGLTLTGSAFNGTIGATTPAAGAFTTLSASGLVTGRSTNGKVLSATNSVNSTFSIDISSGNLDISQLGSSSNMNFIIGSNPVGTFSSTGLSVTGSVSASGGCDITGELKVRYGSSAGNGYIYASHDNLNGIFGTYPVGGGVGGGGLQWKVNGGATPSMTLDASGNLLVGTTAVANAKLQAHQTTDVSYYALAVASSAATATNQYGVYVRLVGDPNDATRHFMQCVGNATERATIRSNGGLANYSANNVNLSDERLKTAFNPAPSYYDRWKQIDFVTYLYKDQTDSELNLGVKAQQLETVCPELVDNSGFGEEPEGEAPYKAVYQTDFSYATAVALQEAIKKIDELTARLEALEA